MWDLSCPDWEQRLRDGRSLIPDLPLNRAEADAAVAIFNALKLHDVPGNPTLGDAAGEWFRDIVRALFGSVVDGKRMIRELFWLVPKKNWKTGGGASLALTAALRSTRPNAEFIFAGATQTVADLSFAAVVGEIEADEGLKKRLRVQDHIKKITVRKTGVKLLIRTFDENVLTGAKPSGGAFIDELHLLGKMAKAEAVIRQLRGGMIPFPESFLVFLTTQSEEPPAGVFKSELAKARAVRDGRLKARTLPVLYEFPERMLKNDEWKDTANWPMVNPNVGRSITIEALQELSDDALSKGEAAYRGFASQHLNVEIGVALKTDQWEGAPFWEGQADPTLTLEALKARSDVCVVGIDGGGLDDLLGLAVLGRDRVTRDWLLWTKAWAHRSVLERRKEIAPRLIDFDAVGEIKLVDDTDQDIAELVAIVTDLEEAGLLPDKHAIGVDVIGITDIVDALELAGITVASERIVGVTQGWKLANMIKTTARRLAGGQLRHGGQALMAWCVGNAKVEAKGNAVLITKQTAGTAKIDPLMALFNAVALMTKNPDVKGTSFWQKPSYMAA